MNKLEMIQKKIQDLKLYREYLLMFKMYNNLTGIYDKDVDRRKYKS